MKYLKTLVPGGVATLLLMVFATTASATVVTSPSGTQLAKGAVIKSQLSGTAALHPPIGTIECKEAGGEGKLTDEGGPTETPSGEAIFGSFSQCNAEIIVLNTGTMEVHTEAGSANGNGTLTSSGSRVTVVYSGFHCIFETNQTDLGRVIGGSPARVLVNGTIPRTGGSSGFFCGSTAAFTAEFTVTSPKTLLID